MFARKRTFHLVSAAGHPNYGDELITLAWLRHLARVAPRATVRLDCPHPGRAAALFHGAHPGLEIVDTLWHVSRVAFAQSPDDPYSRARELMRDLGSPQVDLGILAARQSDAVHLLGGGYLTSTWRENLAVVAAAAELARSGAPMRAFATGLGLTPLSEDDASQLSTLLAGFDHVDVRDAASAAAVDVPQAHDDAFFALGAGAIRIDRRESPAAMLLFQGDVHSIEPMRDAAVASITALRASGVEGTVGLVEANPGVDALVLEAVRQASGGDVRFYPFAEVWTEGLPVRAGQTWFTSRFHIHLVAAMHGARGVAVNAGSDYYGVKHQSLLDEGTGWALVDADDVAESTPSLDESFAARARQLGRERVALADSLYRGGWGS